MTMNAQTPLLVAMFLFPLLGAIVNGLLLRPTSPRRAGVIASGFAGAAFVTALILFGKFQVAAEVLPWTAPWFGAGALEVPWGFRFDAFTALMALIVTGIGTAIHVYSIGYMSEEPTPYRYFAYLNLFLAAMVILITGDNLPVLFVGWEGVGLCSYLLIGYWYEDPEKAKAGMKAFILNRIGDAGFLLGIFLCWDLFQSVRFADMAQVMARPETLSQLPLWKLNLAGICLFVGAMGKSAQIPLYVWLPDAMAGPTPVSALIHAATMVTAGVYLVTRMHFLFDAAPFAAALVGWVGAATSLLAALIATSQRDIKKILAYSTVSQLGLMFLALGCGAYVAAVFHLMTHAFFKALLFLGAGSVIHGLHGEQDIFKMGGLRKEMPMTFWTFAIGWAAICGLPPLSGFFSKDMILYSAAVHGQGPWLWAIGSATSLLTAFYMTRMFVLTFFGTYRGHGHAHESPLVMTVPLVLLAIGSAVAGFVEMPHDLHLLPGYLSQFLGGAMPVPDPNVHGFLSEIGAMAIATGAAGVAITLGWVVYARPQAIQGSAGLLEPFRVAAENKFWVDELYTFLLVKPFDKLAHFMAGFFDKKIIDGAVLLPTRAARGVAAAMSALQFGSAQFYLLLMCVGGLIVVWMVLYPFLLT
jgi:NADH-quinone oxidoreductase subunit L